MASAAAVAGGETPVGKSEFGRRRGVSPARVSQWIDEGKIDGPALVGEGRDQKIIESIACEQLGLRLNTSQRFGNGLGTRLTPLAAPTTQPQPTAAPVPAQLPLQPAKASDQVAEQIALEKLEQIQRANRRAAMEEAADAGRLTDTGAAAQLAGRLAAQMVTVFEGALPELAAAVASRFEIPHRDVLHLMRGEFRKVRASAAAVMRRQAQELPALVPAEIATDDHTDHECRAPGDGDHGEGVGAAAAS